MSDKDAQEKLGTVYHMVNADGAPWCGKEVIPGRVERGPEHTRANPQVQYFSGTGLTDDPDEVTCSRCQE